jgi:hypothetical protein
LSVPRQRESSIRRDLANAWNDTVRRVFHPEGSPKPA